MPWHAWWVRYGDGISVTEKIYTSGTWAVHDGDPFLPIPPALYLFSSGLIGLVGVARRKARLRGRWM